ncbi:hypothetical protein [Roseibium sp.]|uniref:hypothetical protein n=1 Tax=Roseibium sp. TaxID=1936156 RepID=UPI003B51ADC7
MTDQKPSLSIKLTKKGLLLTMKGGDTEQAVEFPLHEASKFFLAFGTGMNEAIKRRMGQVEDPGETANVLPLQADKFAVTDEDGKTYLSVRFANFPTLRMEVPKEALEPTGIKLVASSKVEQMFGAEALVN